jgi:hypothetical protein
VLSDIPTQTDARILVDFRNADDAGVYRWDGGSALVQTVDFFTPIVDDPYIYGEIAAANALSDIYAMGGRPVTALAIAGFPKDGLDHDTIRQVFRGGFETLRAAGVARDQTVVDLGCGPGYFTLPAAEAEDRVAFLREARRLLKPGAEVAVIEFREREGPPGPPIEVRLSEADVAAAATSAGLQVREQGALNDHQLLFRLTAT